MEPGEVSGMAKIEVVALENPPVVELHITGLVACLRPCCVTLEPENATIVLSLVSAETAKEFIGGLAVGAAHVFGR